MKRFPLALLVCIAVWAYVYCRPDLRLQAQVQLRASHGSGITDSVMPAAENPHWLADLQAKFPNNLDVLALTAEVPDERTAARNFDKLIGRFPNTPWLIATRLRHTMGWMRHGRIGGELSSTSWGPGKPARERDGKPNFTPQELQEAIGRCQQGQKLEPDNAYFDWLLAWFLCAGDRDAEALTTIDSTTGKRHFDTHRTDILQSQIRAFELDRPLLWEEKETKLYAETFSEYARWREFARLLTWLGIKAQRRGDHRLATGTYGGLMHIGGLMRRNCSTYIEGLVGMAVGAVGVRGPADAQRTSSAASVPRPYGSQIFQQYESDHGRRDLANALTRERREDAAYRARMSVYLSTTSNISLREANIIALLWHLAVTALFTILVAGAAWLILTLALLAGRLRRACGSATVHWLDVLRGTGFGFAMSGLFLLADAARASWGDMQASAAKSGWFNWSTFSSAGVGSGLFDSCRWIMVAGFIIPLVAACWGYATRRLQRRPRDKSLLAEIKAALASARPFRTLLSIDLKALFDLVATWTYALLLFLAWAVLPYLAFAVPEGWLRYLALYAILLPVASSLVLATVRWIRRPHRRAALVYAYACLRQTLMSYMVSASLCYLLILLITVPYRRAADKRIDAFIRYGEVNAARMMVKS
jgi:hypothetical protein